MTFTFYALARSDGYQTLQPWVTLWPTKQIPGEKKTGVTLFRRIAS